LLLAAVAISAGAIALLHAFAQRLPHARPGERTLHDRRVPRVGGLAILAGALPVLLLDPPAVPGSTAAWLVAGAVVAAISLADDVRSVPPVARLAVHAAAAALVAVLACGPTPGAALAALAVTWAANLYNFMDGSDGLAGTMAVVGFSAYAAVALLGGAAWTSYAAFAVAALPFLVANRPPAAIFMGDVGAVPLGFAAGALGVGGVATAMWPAWFPLLAFLPFLADATITLARRALHGERVWQAHRSHYYQRLNLAGAGHRGTLAIYGAAMLACASLAVACATLRPDAGWAALGTALLVHLIAFGAFDYHVRNKARGSQ
jgi:UDP-N-acetylmuramyl pentapeptide phosphotransferase/UDP-N-acetylglucosamine-1-phosphate transferase